ncbi:hypothetical protein BGX38DRAFT_416020 [Terfezia claveryi]|nr:hypothetical protein BGX38DRAFT_416020 [Terfezia claveryi]
MQYMVACSVKFCFAEKNVWCILNCEASFQNWRISEGVIPRLISYIAASSWLQLRHFYRIQPALCSARFTSYAVRPAHAACDPAGADLSSLIRVTGLRSTALGIRLGFCLGFTSTLYQHDGCGIGGRGAWVWGRLPVQCDSVHSACQQSFKEAPHPASSHLRLKLFVPGTIYDFRPNRFDTVLETVCSSSSLTIPKKPTIATLKA